jgi:hypothetical protein
MAVLTHDKQHDKVRFRMLRSAEVDALLKEHKPPKNSDETTPAPAASTSTQQ